MGEFDADTAALIERAALNTRRTEHDLEAWIFGHLELTGAKRIADLGCGTGKQLFALAEQVPAHTELIGIDISEAAVAEVNTRAHREGATNIRALRASLDDCPGALPDGQFDLILSTYAIYYAADVAGLLESLAPALAPGGAMFLCGPGAGTNREMIALANDLADAPQDQAPEVADFLDARALDALRQTYRSVKPLRLENAVTFAAPAEVMTWWRNHNMFRPALERRVAHELQRHFARAPTFRMTKSVLGVYVDA